MTLTYCEQFGFDAAKIGERLAWFGLSEADHETAQRLQQEVITPSTASIVDEFYGWLQTLEAAKSLLGDEDTRQHLKGTMTHYLTTLGANFQAADYFESRLRIGQAHAWVGVSLSLYQCAYHHLGQLMLALAENVTGLSHEQQRDMRCFLHKILALDMSLAIDTYHSSQVQTLEESLQRMRLRETYLRVEAQTDALTGLSNHEYIVKELTHCLKTSHELGESCAVVMADLDFFKLINDEHGHLVGDKVLMEVARRLRSALRDFDSLGRYGGEEFLIILKRANRHTVPVIAERIRHHVADEPINLHGLEIHATISLGVTFSHTDDHADNAIDRADEALYRAKNAGRNRVEYDN